MTKGAYRFLRIFVGILCAGWISLGTPAGAADRGTQEEAQALTSKAIDVLEKDGLQGGLAEINKATGFRDRDLYVFALDRKGIIIAHAANPALVGIDISRLRDPDGVVPVEANWIAADAHPTGSWVKYKTVNPETKKIEGKLVWIRKIGDILVGVGVYAPDNG